MKKDFSKSWVASKQPRKQRKYRFNAPLHIKSRFLRVNLSKELRKKYERKCIRVRKGDKVKILRGNYKKHVGAVEKVDLNRGFVYIDKVEHLKKDGSKVQRPVHPSNLQIIDINTSDKRRFKREKKSS
ncbi:MAG: 50S ribosomal protein L24 [Candidatus Woesearchaeota archaeon]